MIYGRRGMNGRRRAGGDSRISILFECYTYCALTHWAQIKAQTQTHKRVNEGNIFIYSSIQTFSNADKIPLRSRRLTDAQQMYIRCSVSAAIASFNAQGTHEERVRRPKIENEKSVYLIRGHLRCSHCFANTASFAWRWCTGRGNCGAEHGERERD